MWATKKDVPIVPSEYTTEVLQTTETTQQLCTKFRADPWPLFPSWQRCRHPMGMSLSAGDRRCKRPMSFCYLQSGGGSWNALLGQIHIRYPAVKLMQACDPGHSTRTFSAILSPLLSQGAEARVPLCIYLCMWIRCVTHEWIPVFARGPVGFAYSQWRVMNLWNKPQTLCKHGKKFYRGGWEQVNKRQGHHNDAADVTCYRFFFLLGK